MPVPPSSDRRASEPAFSLLELLVALAILATVAAGAVLVWPRIEAALQLEAGLHQVAADLRGAQTLAIASAQRVRLVFTPGATAYARERLDDDGAYHLDGRRDLPRGIAVASINSGGDLTFGTRGDAENGTLVLTDRRGTRRSLVLNQRGRITLTGAGP